MDTLYNDARCFFTDVFVSAFVRRCERVFCFALVFVWVLNGTGTSLDHYSDKISTRTICRDHCKLFYKEFTGWLLVFCEQTNP